MNIPPNASRARPPSSRGWQRSSSSTVWPLRSSSSVLTSPARPAPTTIASGSLTSSAMPGATCTSTSSGSGEASARRSSTPSSSGSAARRALMPYPAATAAVSSAGRSRPGAPGISSKSVKNLRIAYSSLRSTRNVTGTL